MKNFLRRGRCGWFSDTGGTAVSDPLHPVGAGGHGGKVAEQFHTETHRTGVLSGKPGGGAEVHGILSFQYFAIDFKIFLKNFKKVLDEWES